MFAQLKNGLNVEIRSISLAEGDARHRFFVELSLQQTGIVHTCEEIDFHTHESHDKIADFLRNKRGLWLLALSKGEIIGEIDISVKNLSRIKHVGVLSMGILKDYQRLGLGSALLKEAIAWSANLGLKRIELSVFASNKAARKLYEKHGFVEEGLKKNFLRRTKTLFEDDVLMAKYL